MQLSNQYAKDRKRLKHLLIVANDTKVLSK